MDKWMDGWLVEYIDKVLGIHYKHHNHLSTKISCKYLINHFKANKQNESKKTTPNMNQKMCSCHAREMSMRQRHLFQMSIYAKSFKSVRVILYKRMCLFGHTNKMTGNTTKNTKSAVLSSSKILICRIDANDRQHYDEDDYTHLRLST